MTLTHDETLRAIADHVFFADDPRYIQAKAITTPRDLARRLTNALAAGADVDKDGPAVVQACKTLGIARTYTAIRAYLEGR